MSSYPFTLVFDLSIHVKPPVVSTNHGMHGNLLNKKIRNGWITLGFGLGNMFFDFICLFNFYKTHKQTGQGWELIFGRFW